MNGDINAKIADENEKIAVILSVNLTKVSAHRNIDGYMAEKPKPKDK